MNILVISDQESKALYEYFDRSRLENIDLIISCGDLRADYLSFLATFAHGPLLYVRGNHDDSYEEHPPEGCICIEDDIFVYRGIRILGLGGSLRYRDGQNQFSQNDMYRRVFRLWFKIWRHKGFDILVTHAPEYRASDVEKPDFIVHGGFKAFCWLMDKYAPRFMVHGHVHMNYESWKERVRKYKDTTIINAYERFVFQTEEPEYPGKFHHTV